MNLNELAESDLSLTLENKESGFGVSILFRDSQAVKQEVICQTTEIGFYIDSGTGQLVSGEYLEAVARMSTLAALDIPRPRKEDVITFQSTNGAEKLMKVQDTIPDSKLGVFKLILEAVKI